MKKAVLPLLVSAIFFAGSAHAGVFGSSDTSSDVVKSDARTVNRVLKGTILQVSEAKIEEGNGTKATGATAGMATGAALGAGPNGKGGLFGAAIGAVVGGIGGAVASASLGSQKAQDLIIQTSTGDIINITQAVDEKVGEFAEGDQILVVYKGDKARVLRNKMGQAAATPVAETQAAQTATAETPKSN